MLSLLGVASLGSRTGGPVGPALGALAVDCYRRGFANPAKGKKGGDADKDTDAGQGGKTIPVNFLKNGADPVVKSDDEYPDWLWNLELPSLPVLNKKDVDDLTLPEFRRLIQLKNREIIKDQNADTNF